MAERSGSRPDPVELLGEFLDEWREDRREGRTMRVLHKNVTDLDAKLDNHAGRLTTLEAQRAAQREAEDRAWANGTGRHNIVPVSDQPRTEPPMRASPSKPPQSWWARSPFKEAIGYGAAALVAGGIGVATGHQIAVPAPAAVEELPHPVATQIPQIEVVANVPPPPVVDAGAPDVRRPRP